MSGPRSVPTPVVDVRRVHFMAWGLLMLAEMPHNKLTRNLAALALGAVVAFSAGFAAASCMPIVVRTSFEITANSPEAEQMLARFVPEGQRACIFRDANNLTIAACDSEAIFDLTFSQLGER